MAIRAEHGVILAAAFAMFGVGCGGGTESLEMGTQQGAVSSPEAAGPDCNGNATCTFSRGVESCVLVEQHTVQSSHVETSGCIAFDGTKFVPGRRSRTFLDVLQVTDTTTTERHGHCGKIISSSTVTTTQIISRTLISDVCEAL